MNLCSRHFQRSYSAYALVPDPTNSFKTFFPHCLTPSHWYVIERNCFMNRNSLRSGILKNLSEPPCQLLCWNWQLKARAHKWSSMDTFIHWWTERLFIGVKMWSSMYKFVHWTPVFDIPSLFLNNIYMCGALLPHCISAFNSTPPSFLQYRCDN